MNLTPTAYFWLGYAAALGVVGAVALYTGCAHGAEATLQSARPWTIAQCDRLAGRRASAVFNRSIYSHGGWPLWQVVCLYPK